VKAGDSVFQDYTMSESSEHESKTATFNEPHHNPWNDISSGHQYSRTSPLHNTSYGKNGLTNCWTISSLIHKQHKHMHTFTFYRQLFGTEY